LAGAVLSAQLSRFQGISFELAGAVFENGNRECIIIWRIKPSNGWIFINRRFCQHGMEDMDDKLNADSNRYTSTLPVTARDYWPMTAIQKTSHIPNISFQIQSGHRAKQTESIASENPASHHINMKAISLSYKTTLVSCVPPS
jgi:hypothetical protein